MGRKKKSEPKRVREEALASVHKKERARRWKKEKERKQGKKQMERLEQGKEI